MYEEIKRLKELLDMGALTQEEYDKQKRAALGLPPVEENLISEEEKPEKNVAEKELEANEVEPCCSVKAKEDSTETSLEEKESAPQSIEKESIPQPIAPPEGYKLVTDFSPDEQKEPEKAIFSTIEEQVESVNEITPLVSPSETTASVLTPLKKPQEAPVELKRPAVDSSHSGFEDSAAPRAVREKKKIPEKVKFIFSALGWYVAFVAGLFFIGVLMVSIDPVASFLTDLIVLLMFLFVPWTVVVLILAFKPDTRRRLKEKFRKRKEAADSELSAKSKSKKKRVIIVVAAVVLAVVIGLIAFVSPTLEPDEVIGDWHGVGLTDDGDLEYSSYVDEYSDLNIEFEEDGYVYLELDSSYISGEWKSISGGKDKEYAIYFDGSIEWTGIITYSSSFGEEILFLYAVDDPDYQLAFVKE